MKRSQIVWMLKLSAFFVFAGRAYEHLFWDAPYRSLLWDQNLLQKFVEGVFNVSWKEYVTSMKADNIIQNIIKINGVFYAICAALCLIVKQESKRFSKQIIAVGGFLLLFLSILLSKSKFYHLAMFLEHSIQFGAPLLLVYLFKINGNLLKLITPLKIITALTFVSHGLYALGKLYPLPGNFVTMTLNILPITENLAKEFLFIAGVLDFVAVVFIFIPRLQKIGLIYAAIWGLITAFARITSGLTYDVSFSIFHQYLYTTIYRIPHGLSPLITLFIINLKEKKQENY
ncbi:hypothetical protein H9W90_13790 [Polaribacter pectinis]|uniref:Uncharacterized protein n=1 Tax=Polaribacter pectinis TaxID=2738844 RepID=A0A7G9L9E9_9FLAO|nr:hypothetical protein [Polaribacter pectinis]QNM85248.1 hypothetical protein H9W90_13790 [Polaribacter pectinis]